jgi:flap endonuclease-1
MGVKLSDLVVKKDVSWNDLSEKILAVDSSNMLFQFISSIRQRDGTPLMDSQGRVTSHLVGISSRIPSLLSKGIKPCFVFDGKAPALKFGDQERMKEQKEKAAKKLEQAKEEEDEESMHKYSRMTAKLDKNMIEESKKLLEAIGLPVIQAPSEAEAQASYMCKKKKVWAVASSDYDCLLFQSPRMLINLTLSQKRKTSSGGIKSVSPQIIELSQVLNDLQIDHEQLLVLGIMVGTDYNPGGIKGIGPKKALKLLQTDQNFDTIFKGLDADFDWKEVLEVFKSMPVSDDCNLDFKEPDEEKIKEILVEDHDFSEERVDKIIEKMSDAPKKDKSQTGLNQWIKN